MRTWMHVLNLIGIGLSVSAASADSSGQFSAVARSVCVAG
jgi:hypothetical protein